jgi:hypothetical protein
MITVFLSPLASRALRRTKANSSKESSGTASSTTSRNGCDAHYSQRPPQVKCAETNIPGTDEAFKGFFKQHHDEFPGIDGEQFFVNVRSGLLHQSQTRNGLVINIYQPEEAVPKGEEILVGKILYRDSLVTKLRACFLSFLTDLRDNPTSDAKWNYQNARSL